MHIWTQVTYSTSLQVHTHTHTHTHTHSLTHSVPPPLPDLADKNAIDCSVTISLAQATIAELQGAITKN